MPTPIKPTHKSITAYYQTLLDLAAQNVSHEMGLRRAFQELLAETAKLHDWTLIPEESSKTTAGATIRPDATLRDKNTLPRGYWESKDTADSLAKEIAKKSAKGYSLANTIFEDSQTAILYQNKKHAFTADLSDPQAICDLLNQFYAHTEPDFEHWEEAVEDFKDRVPDLARGLVTIIETAHKKNQKFKDAFADFFTLCQTALNPNIAQADVDEMLIQHLLTERLFRTIFNVPDFINRNVIAAEVEKVIEALSAQSFSRADYLKSLDRFYLAIENAAKHLDWTDKQHFLNVIYERFFQGYSVKTADTMGIVYTPQPIVDFMCASVAEVLRKEFNKDLGDPDVFVLDPCTGTGNFIINLLRRIPQKKLRTAYLTNFFANEIMLMPYYIAALNIEHAFYDASGIYEPFEGLCFVDTLDIAEHKQGGFDFFIQRNTERVNRQRKAPITVVIGNPPYNVGQMIHNEQNKNRSYEQIDKRIKETYAKGSAATSVSKLNDPYVKFFRWATDRIGKADGIICFVSNSSFVEKRAFDSMRRHLFKDFDVLYVLDLQGNIRKDSMRDGISLGEENTVFGLGAMVGIAITVLIKKASSKEKKLFYHSVPFRSTRAEKFALLAEAQSTAGISWDKLQPDERADWLVPECADEFSALLPMGGKEFKKALRPESIFQYYSLGVATHRDNLVYDYCEESLLKKMEPAIENYNSEVDRYRRVGGDQDPDDFLNHEKVVWDRDLKQDLVRGKYATFHKSKVRLATYRPFTHKHLFLDRVFNAEVYGMPLLFPEKESSNQSIIVGGYGRKAFTTLLANSISDLNFYADPGQCFPFYTYDEDGTNRRENITDWALSQFRSRYHDDKISKWHIFHYVYALLHHPAYRAKFADNLKRELPRIPFAPDFRAFSEAGKKLADLHLNYESAKEFPLTEIVTPGTPRTPRVESKMKLSKDKTSITANESLTLAGIPPETFNYKLGNRSALEWIIDQYQMYTDKRTGITSDPNAWGEEHYNPEYIVQLIGKIITVSLETQKIIAAIPTEFSEPEKP